VFFVSETAEVEMRNALVYAPDDGEEGRGSGSVRAFGDGRKEQGGGERRGVAEGEEEEQVGPLIRFASFVNSQ